MTDEPPVNLTQVRRWGRKDARLYGHPYTQEYARLIPDETVRQYYLDGAAQASRTARPKDCGWLDERAGSPPASDGDATPHD